MLLLTKNGLAPCLKLIKYTKKYLFIINAIKVYECVDSFIAVDTLFWSDGF